MFKNKLVLYWGDHCVDQQDLISSSIIFNGIYSPVGYLSVYNSAIWSLNVKVLQHKDLYQQMYPYALMKDKNGNLDVLIEYIKSNSSDVMLCDYGQVNEIPLAIRGSKKVIELPRNN
jgi:hypothetical protein